MHQRVRARPLRVKCRIPALAGPRPGGFGLPNPPADGQPADVAEAREVLRLDGVSVDRGGRRILAELDWVVRSDERWVLLGPNGSGKTTLIRLASLYLHPSRGELWVLGQMLGRCDVRRLRARIGVASQSFADLLRAEVIAADVVMTAKHAALEPWWHTYTDDDRHRAHALLERLGARSLAERRFGTLSSGERQRVQLARVLMADPELLLLDEPTAGLDLGGREDLVARLGDLAVDASTAATVLVTHHVEEIPTGFTHALLLRGGRVQAAGPLGEVITAEALSRCFGVGLRLARTDGRWQAWAEYRSG